MDLWTPTASRRSFLVGAAAAGTALAGCVGVVGKLSDASESVSVLAAGSLQHVLETRLRPAVDTPLRIEAHGSATVARLVAEGQRDPDVVALADVALFNALLSAPWHARFATNELVLAYNQATRAGREVGAAAHWYEPFLVDGSVPALGRTDPDLDPLGYRTLFMLSLAADVYGRPALTDGVLDAAAVYPETELLARFETDAVDAAIVYRNMAEERGYPIRNLPTAIDLSDPALAERYSRESYTLSDGTVVRGGPIQYGATLWTDEGDARSVFRTLVAGDVLGDGFRIPADHPRYVGDVPDGLAG